MPVKLNLLDARKVNVVTAAAAKICRKRNVSTIEADAYGQTLSIISISRRKWHGLFFTYELLTAL
jgi:hypothetical protein